MEEDVEGEEDKRYRKRKRKEVLSLSSEKRRNKHIEDGKEGRAGKKKKVCV